MIGLMFLIGLTLVLSALFSGVETAFTAANTLRVEQQAREGRRNAVAANALLKQPERFLTITLMGNNVVNVAATSMTTYLFLLMGLHYNEMLTLLVLTPVLLLFGEMIPKAIFRLKATESAILFAPFLRWCEWLLAPVLYIGERYSRLLAKLFGRTAGNTSRKIMRGRLHATLQESKHRNVLEAHESRMIEEILRFSDRVLGDVMIPRDRVVAVRKNATWTEVRKTAAVSHYTRFPVEENGQFQGFINIFDLFYRKGRWQRNIRTLTIWDFTTPLGRLVDKMRTGRQAMVAVRQNNDIVGIATLEDIVEKIMGDIDNELGRT